MIKAKYLNHLIASGKFDDFIDKSEGIPPHIFAEQEAERKNEENKIEHEKKVFLDSIKDLSYNELKELAREYDIAVPFGAKKIDVARQLGESGRRRQEISLKRSGQSISSNDSTANDGK